MNDHAMFAAALAEAGRPDIAATWKANPFRGELCSGDSRGWTWGCAPSDGWA